MSHTVTLQDGVKIGENVYHTLMLRAPTAGDLIDAQAEAEHPVMTPEGYQLLVSNATMMINTLRRQVSRIGDDISGPMQLSTIRALTARDLETLQAEADAVDGPLRVDLEKRGRPDGASGARDTR